MRRIELTPMRCLIIATVIGLAVRLLLAPFTTSTYDVSSWAGVINGINTGEGLYETGYYWYAPTWGYILSALAPLMDALGINVQGIVVPDLSSNDIYNATARITVPEFNLIYKLPLILSDVLVGFALYSIVKSLKNDEHLAIVAFCLWFLNPLTIWNSSIQGMFETLSILGMVISIACLLRGQYFFAGAGIVFSGITKLFPIILVPLMIGYIIAKHGTRRDSLKNITMSVLGGVTVFAIIFIPVALEGDFSEALAFIMNRVESFETDVNSGFSLFQPNWNNIFAISPILFIVVIALACIMTMSKRNLEHRFMLLAAVTMCILFAWPFFPPYHQYALNMVPLMILAYCMGSRYLLTPLVLTSLVFFLAALFWMGPEMLYPLAAGDMVSFDTIGHWMDVFKQPMLQISEKMEYIKFIPALMALEMIAMRVVMDVRERRICL